MFSDIHISTFSEIRDLSEFKKTVLFKPVRFLLLLQKYRLRFFSGIYLECETEIKVCLKAS